MVTGISTIQSPFRWTWWCKKILENALEMFRINARSRIAYCDEDAILLAPLGTDRQLTCPGLDRAHCFDGVQD